MTLAIKAAEHLVGALDDAGVGKPAARQFIACMAESPEAGAAVAKSLGRLLDRLGELGPDGATRVIDFALPLLCPEGA